MPGSVTGTIGQDDVRLDNAATESTLALLVSSMEKMAKGLGVKGKDYDKELKNLKTKADLDEKNNKFTKEANVEREKENKAIKNTSSTLNSLSAGVGIVAGSLRNLSNTLGSIVNKAFTDTVPSVESFASQLPIVGGLFGALAKGLDQNVAAFRSLSAAGIDMGAGLFAAQSHAAKAGLSLAEFSNVTKNNSATLARFGGTAGDGAKVFSGVMSNFRKSGFAESAGRLGITMEELAENTAGYMELQSRTGRAGSMSQAQLSAGAQAYNLELDKLSRATGISRKSIDEQNQALARDAKMKLATAKLSDEQRTALSAQIAQLDKLDPTGKMSAGFKDMIATGGVAVTKEAKAYQLALQSAGQDASKLTRDINNGVEGSVAASDKAFVELGKRAGEMTEAQRKQGATMGALGKDSVYLSQAAMQGYKGITDSAVVAEKEQKKAEEDRAKAAANVDRQLLSLVQSLQKLILSSGLMDVMVKVVTFGIKLLSEGIKFLTPVIKGIADYISGFIKFAQSNSMEAIFKKLFDDAAVGIGKAAGFIWDKVVPKLVDGIGSAMKALWENPKILGYLGAGIAIFFAAAAAKAAASNALAAVKNTVASKLPFAEAAGKGMPAKGSLPAAPAAAGKVAAAAPAAGSVGGAGGMLKGLADGVKAFANPQAAIGIGVVTLAIIGLSKAFEIASPGFDAFGKMVKSVLEGVSPVVKSFGDGLRSVLEGASPVINSFGEAFRSVLDGIATVIGSVGNSISGTIASIADGIGNTIGKITEFKTAGITATTEQIERLSAIPADKLIGASAGIEAMKKALEGFGPGIMGSIGSAIGGLIGGDQADKISKLADAGLRLEPVGGYMAAVTSGLKGFETVKFDNIQIGAQRFKELSTSVSAAATAFKQLEPSTLEKVGEKISSLSASFKEVGKSIAATVTGAKDVGKTAQDKLLSDLNTKMEQLNTSMATLVEIQSEMLGPTKKTAKNTRAASGKI